MKRSITISSPPIGHNGGTPGGGLRGSSPSRLERGRPGHRAALPPATCIILLAALAGCAASRPTPVAMPAWKLASADPGAIVHIAQARSRPDRPLPEQVLQRLCPEFALIVVKRPSDWDEVRQCLDLPDSHVEIDFSEGMVIGLHAHPGERAEPGWPIHLTAVRQRAGAGHIEAAFLPGLYYPLETGGYVELAYVPGLRQVQTVCIDHRIFAITGD